MRKCSLVVSSLAVVIMATSVARAVPLVTYEFQGQPGTETTVAPASVAANVIGANFAETGLTPVAGANSINASGWTNSGAAYTFGFTLASGAVATVNDLVLSTRSSATGPGFLSVQASVNGGAYTTIASLTQSGTAFNDQTLAFTPLTGITAGVAFRVVAATQVSAGGGTIGVAGTFRVGDFNPSGTPSAFTIDGTIAVPTATAVPEPSSLLVLLGGLAGLSGLYRRLT